MSSLLGHPIIEIVPESGLIPANSKTSLKILFYPQEESKYNFNILCDVKKKSKKLSLNIKGEGYVNHPFLQLEQSSPETIQDSSFDNTTTGGVATPTIPLNSQNHDYVTLRPMPSINYADFGLIQVLDSIEKKVKLANNGKYTFDYVWDLSGLSSNRVSSTKTSGGGVSSMISLQNGKLEGSMNKSEEILYKLTFSPTREVNLEGYSLSFKCGKLIYTVMLLGRSVQPALKFSFMNYNFGNCFITSPGGNTVIEEAILTLTNHDPINNIAIESLYQKTRVLWVECQPTVIESGQSLHIPIKFAPRELKEYSFALP